MGDVKTTLSEKTAKISNKISSNIYIQGVTQGIMSILPVIIIGAFSSLFLGLPIEAWKNLINSTGISSVLNVVVNATTNMLGLYFTYGIARTLSEKLEVKSKILGIFAMIVYIVLLPLAQGEDGVAHLSFDYLGTKGMIIGIIVAILTVKLYKYFIDHKVTIKMPQGTPDYVSNSFSSLIPGFIIIIISIIINMLFKLTPYGDAFNLFYNVLQIPLTVVMGGSIVSNAVIAGLTQLSWLLGIHPGFIQGISSPILFGLDGANQAAFAAGQVSPNILGMAFTYICTTATLFPAIAVAILIGSKSKQLKTVGKIGVAPAFFGISEPFIFGLPVVFNATIIIPWILAPIMNLTLAYIATSMGLVARCAGVTVFNVPMIFTGIMNGSISIAVMEVVLFVLDILLFIPFIKAIDKKYLQAEKEAEQA